jgi:hypothetical protein
MTYWVASKVDEDPDTFKPDVVVTLERGAQ